MSRFIVITLIVFLVINPLDSCTIFELVDSQSSLFCNNEDTSNPITRIWFQPGGEGYLGCAYVGLDNGWPQGGLNSAGLCFDWVAGYYEQWERTNNLKYARMHPSQRMLESCQTIQEAIQFYKTYWEPSLGYAKMFVADSTGASVIIGVKNGNLYFDEAKQSRGFGYGGKILGQKFQNHVEPTISNGFDILHSCFQEGKFSTKYSNIFDLKNRDIYLHQTSEWSNYVKLNLAAELLKGEHYYDIFQIQHQVGPSLKPLLQNMKRYLLDHYQPILDKEPEITNLIKDFSNNLSNGVLDPNLLSKELINYLSPQKYILQKRMSEFGKLINLSLVDRKEGKQGSIIYRYCFKFTNATLLQQVVIDKNNKIAYSVTEDVIYKN